MLQSAIVSSLLLAFASAYKTEPFEDFYNAAVVEYHPLQGVDGNDTLYLNTQLYVKIIGEATKYADIVVFPESGLLGYDGTIFLKVPFGGHSSQDPGGNENLHPALGLLSEAARNNSIYVVVNLHEEEPAGNSTNRYNTNVVFDRNGSILARYRKYHLFGEPGLNITNKPEHSYFDTDFGVRFGMFTCFDIIFKEPTLVLKNHNVTDYVFPSDWFSELPFVTAIQEQAGWSYSTGSNLLAAGKNGVNMGNSGSGIYAGKNGPVVYTMSNWNEILLLTAKVYKAGRNGISSGKIRTLEQVPPGEKGRLAMITDRLSDYVTHPLMLWGDFPIRVNSSNLTENYVFEEELCQGKLCCHFSVDMSYRLVRRELVDEAALTEADDGFHRHHYRAAVFDGTRGFRGVPDTAGLQVCGLLPCLNESEASCGLPTRGAPLTEVLDGFVLYWTGFSRAVLTATGLESGGFVLPSLLEAGGDPRDYGSLPAVDRFNFSHSGGTAQLNFTSRRLGAAAIYHRVFSRDGSPAGRSWATSARPCLYVTLIIALYHFSRRA